MSQAAKLRVHMHDIRMELGRIRHEWVPDLLEYLDLTLEASRGRAAAASKRGAERSARIRERIRVAAGALAHIPRSTSLVQRRIATRGPATFGLDQVPDLRTIRAALKEKDTAEPERAHALSAVSYGAVQDNR